MNHYKTSDGSRVSKREVDKRVRNAKQEKINEFLEKYDYIFCEDCGNNNCVPIDCSHDISVDECQKSGRTELAWDVSNITLRGRKCHRVWDKSC